MGDLLGPIVYSEYWGCIIQGNNTLQGLLYRVISEIDCELHRINMIVFALIALQTEAA